ncbi:hypothetical protein BT93_D1429 [Corymbia citriodora subsp. variegata]|nr:hypothetical protein BT93_D1429 [Corymbia citriodora subsp. variegata]
MASSENMIGIFKDGNDNQEDPPMALKGKGRRMSKEERRPIARASKLKRTSQERLRAAALKRKKRISKQSLRAASKRNLKSRNDFQEEKYRPSPGSCVPGTNVDPETCSHPSVSLGICDLCWELLPRLSPMPHELVMEGLRAWP